VGPGYGFASLEKTRRLLVVHEAVRVGGFGAEIAATVAEHMAHLLRAPIRRLGAPRAPISYAKPLEDLLRVTPEKILATAMSQMDT
jgi:pyruvate dehydrogenase E1 component beta subunit